jgi:hypothetical protein
MQGRSALRPARELLLFAQRSSVTETELDRCPMRGRLRGSEHTNDVIAVDKLDAGEFTAARAALVEADRDQPSADH